MDLVDQLEGVCAVRPAADDDQVDGVLPRLVASPASTEETSALLRHCHEHRLAVVVRGHGSKLAWGRPPERADVVLDTTRMADLVEHARGDLVATAGAGMPLAELQGALAEGGHQLVVDDLVGGVHAGGSTLGGAMATNLAGPRRMWTGAIRDLVIGVRFVRADGTIAKAGGKVVKNVAGYDLAKLLTGSYGTLAVVTEVTVRLHPIPEGRLDVVATVPSDRLGEVLAHVVHSQLAPHALEIHAAPGRDPVVGVLLTGTAQGASARADALAAQLRQVARLEPTVTADGRHWHGRLPLSERDGSRRPTGRPTLLRTTARLSGIPELVAAANAHGLTVTGSAGAGVLYAAAAEDRPVEEVAGAVQAVRTASTRLGGSTVVLDAPPPVKAAVDSWGPVPALDLMRRVKAEFDPRRILAPGRFVGGI